MTAQNEMTQTVLLDLSDREMRQFKQDVETLLAPGRLSPGARLLVSLIAHTAVLSLDSLAALGVPGRICRGSIGGNPVLEWQLAGGWRDRRWLPNRTAELLIATRGLGPTRADTRELVAALTCQATTDAGGSPLEAFIRRAQGLWARVAPPVLLGHASRAAPFQLLDATAWARRIARLPARASTGSSWVDQVDRVLSLTLVSRARRDAGFPPAIAEVISTASKLARQRGCNQTGRRALSELIDGLLPQAAGDDHASALLLAATRHLIETGGIDGDLLVLSTLASYLGLVLPLVANKLKGKSLQDLLSAEWDVIYAGVLARVSDTQVRKAAACLQGLHRFLMLCGVEPLRRPLLSDHILLPPAAQVVWVHELEWALLYIEASSECPRIKWQARLSLLFAAFHPCRTYDPSSLRIQDILPGPPMVVSLAPSMSLGGSKSPASRLQVDITCQRLAAAFMDAMAIRRSDSTVETDLLMGRPGHGHEKHEPERTLALVNHALRYATGLRTTSFYDLRRTVISLKAEELMCREQDQSDCFHFHKLSAASGHAAPTATANYVHLVEPAFEHFGRQLFPDAWIEFSASGLREAVFPAVEQGRLGEWLPPAPFPSAATKSDLHATWPRQLDFFRRMTRGESRESAAARSELCPDLARRYVGWFEQALDESDLLPSEFGRTEAGRDALIEVFITHCRASLQAKYRPIAAWLSTRVSDCDVLAIHRIWRAWCQCRRDAHISLDRPFAAVELLRALSDCGIQRQQLLLVSSKPALRPLDRRVAELIGPKGPGVQQRRGEPVHRMARADRRADPAKCRGASASVLGLHWLLLMARIASREIEGGSNGN